MQRIVCLLVALASTDAMAHPAAADEPTVIDCATSKTPSITTSDGNYQVTGTCDKLTISGSANRVVIEATKNLAITGARNTVKIDAVDKLAALGSDNKITYGRGLTLATPKIAMVGKGNVSRKVASPPTDPTAKVPGEPTFKVPVGATVSIPIDCGKTPTPSLAGNDGNYRVLGACKSIAIRGNHNSLKVVSARRIEIAGNHNFVEAAAVDALSTSGSDNIARWTKGVSGAKPKVANSGERNTIEQTK